jgi:hypothetical protein
MVALLSLFLKLLILPLRLTGRLEAENAALRGLFLNALTCIKFQIVDLRINVSPPSMKNYPDFVCLICR